MKTGSCDEQGMLLIPNPETPLAPVFAISEDEHKGADEDHLGALLRKSRLDLVDTMPRCGKALKKESKEALESLC